MVLTEDSICIQILKKNDSPIIREINEEENFTFVILKNSYANPLNINILTDKMENLGENSIQINSIPARAGDLHVYASGINVPFVVTCGSAEGWCSAVVTGPGVCTVSNLRYVVAAAWPSDGLGIWSDYENSATAAWHTPAWPSSAYTTVSGSWTTTLARGAIAAEASYTILADKVPILHTVYDVCYMNGTHQ